MKPYPFPWGVSLAFLSVTEGSSDVWGKQGKAWREAEPPKACSHCGPQIMNFCGVKGLL